VVCPLFFPEDSERTPAEQRAAMTWTQRLKRVFNIDVSVCEQCGGSVRIIACVEDSDVIERIPKHLSRTQADRYDPVPQPGRGPPQLDIFA
jgi:hypothetical protein